METVILDIVETARQLRRAFDRRAAALEATPAQWRLLARLARKGDGQRQVDLAEGLDVEPITLARMVDRLEQSGLVERRRDEEDRRAWRIFLTPRAAPIIDHLQTLGDAFHEDVLAGVSEEQIKAAQDVLAIIRDNLNQTGEGAVRKTS